MARLTDLVGRPRLGAVLRFGPFRLYVPLLTDRPRTRRVKVYRHEGCTTDHPTYEAAEKCASRA